MPITKSIQTICSNTYVIQSIVNDPNICNYTFLTSSGEPARYGKFMKFHADWKKLKDHYPVYISVFNGNEVVKLHVTDMDEYFSERYIPNMFCENDLK